MDEIVEKIDHGLFVCAVTGTSTVHITKEDVEKILAWVEKQVEEKRNILEREDENRNAR